MRKLLVANRGEIALRVIAAARELGIATVAVSGEADRDALHVAAADEHRLVAASSPAEAYLRADLLARAALDAGADALHPGYGFLAESPALARACEEADLTFVGPPAVVLELCGDKVEARRLAERAGVPVLSGEAGAPQELARAAERLGFPLVVKALAGGGGRGIRRVAERAALEEALAASAREAEASFGDGRLYLERWLPRARHIEVQVLADAAGSVVELGERDCSIQRRHQKLVEEAPSPALDAAWRRRLGEAAVKVAAAAGYRNAGTVEFLLELGERDEPRAFYFIEINARIQVEHPVTEAVRGLDLVGWQLRLAAGEALAADLAAGGPRGHAIECRICAESPPSFLPSAGKLLVFRPPGGPGIRFDAGYAEGDEVTTAFDSLLGKVIAWGPDRAAAIRRMELALASTVVLGVETNVDYLQDVLRNPAFRAGRSTTDFLDREMAAWEHEPPGDEVLAIAAASRGAGAVCSAAGRSARTRGPWDEVRRLGAATGGGA